MSMLGFTWDTAIVRPVFPGSSWQRAFTGKSLYFNIWVKFQYLRHTHSPCHRRSVSHFFLPRVPRIRFLTAFDKRLIVFFFCCRHSSYWWNCKFWCALMDCFLQVGDYSFCDLHPLPRQSLFASPSLSTWLNRKVAGMRFLSGGNGSILVMSIS